MDLYGSPPPRTYQNSNFDGLFKDVFFQHIKKCNGQCRLQHSLKQKKVVVQGNCCLQVAICHEEKMFFETNNHIVTKKTCVETCNS